MLSSYIVRKITTSFIGGFATAAGSLVCVEIKKQIDKKNELKKQAKGAR